MRQYNISHFETGILVTSTEGGRGPHQAERKIPTTNPQVDQHLLQLVTLKAPVGQGLNRSPDRYQEVGKIARRRDRAEHVAEGRKHCEYCHL